jgi:GNAT superfamily N-acetyltransferase
MIRKATIEEANAVWDIRTSAIRAIEHTYYPKNDLLKWTPVQMPSDFAEAMLKNEWWVAVSENQIIATGFIDLIKKRIEAIFVIPDYQGKGFAKMMISHLEAIARDHGLEELFLDATLNAFGFYQKQGYQKVKDSMHVSPLGVSLPCISMKKKL